MRTVPRSAHQGNWLPSCRPWEGETAMRLSLLFIVLAVSLLCTARGESQAPIFSVEESLAARAARSKRLQQELKMDKDQIAKLHNALAKVRQGSKGEMAQLMHLNLPE